ncbi:MAG: hypothetical protein H6719_19775 [Sandaracinaceae bacterium]|nr:hypothetical protein [Sandaracinaceae bacterium]
MPRERHLRAVLRTPVEAVLDVAVEGLRVPCASGLVGIRPGAEPCVLPVAHGLILIHTAGGTSLAASAGGLLWVTDDTATLLSPLILRGDTEESLLAELGRALEAPSSGLATRRQLAHLEQRIARELGDSARSSR